MTDIESKEHDELLVEVARQRKVIEDLARELAVARTSADTFEAAAFAWRGAHDLLERAMQTVGCGWCGSEFKRDENSPNIYTEEMREHSTSCAQHPLAQEVRKLRTLAAPARLIAGRWAAANTRGTLHHRTVLDIGGLLDQLTEAAEQLGG